MDGLSWKIPFKWLRTGGSPLSGNPHVYLLWRSLDTVTRFVACNTRQCVEIRTGETCSRSASPNLGVASSFWSGNSGAGGCQQSLDFHKPNHKPTKTSESAEGSDPLSPVEVMAQPNETLRSGMNVLRKIRPGQDPWKQKWSKELRTCPVS